MRKPTFCICENRDADQRLCYRYTDSTILLLPKFKISSLWAFSVIAQPGLCRTTWEIPKTGFLTTRIIFCTVLKLPPISSKKENHNGNRSIICLYCLLCASKLFTHVMETDFSINNNIKQGTCVFKTFYLPNITFLTIYIHVIIFIIRKSSITVQWHQKFKYI